MDVAFARAVFFCISVSLRLWWWSLQLSVTVLSLTYAFHWKNIIFHNKPIMTSQKRNKRPRGYHWKVNGWPTNEGRLPPHLILSQCRTKIMHWMPLPFIRIIWWKRKSDAILLISVGGPEGYNRARCYRNHKSGWARSPPLGSPACSLAAQEGPRCNCIHAWPQTPGPCQQIDPFLLALSPP